MQGVLVSPSTGSAKDQSAEKDKPKKVTITIKKTEDLTGYDPTIKQLASLLVKNQVSDSDTALLLIAA